MQFNGEFWYKTILNTMSISYLVTLSWFSFRGTAPHIAHVIRRSRNHRKKKKCRWFFHTSKISRKRPQSSTIKRPASQFGVCKWGYAFHRNHKIMKASSATMVEPCFVSVTEKEHTFTKMETCTRASGNGTKSTDMVFTHMWTEKCESC